MSLTYGLSLAGARPLLGTVDLVDWCYVLDGAPTLFPPARTDPGYAVVALIEGADGGVVGYRLPEAPMLARGVTPPLFGPGAARHLFFRVRARILEQAFEFA